MNIINNVLLKLALLPAPLYRQLGVDLPRLKCIVSTKLMMDDRRPNTFQQVRTRKTASPIGMATLGTMLISALMGLFYLVAFFLGTDIVSQLTLYFLFFLLMLATSLISDFTAVLIDVRDNYIILPKPVNDRTVVVARLMHIFIHVCKLVVPMALPGLIYMIVQHQLYGGLVFLLMVLPATVFCIFLINAVYIVILKITTPARFQSVISYFQIIFAVVLYAGYQLMPRLLGNFKGAFVNLSDNPFILLCPSYWFAAGWKVLAQFGGTPREYTGLLFSLLLPFASIWVVVRFLAPAFNQKLSQLGSTEQHTASTADSVTSLPTAPAYLLRIAGWLTRKGPERAGFLFTWKMTARSRDFKLKVYPGIGYMLVLIVMVFINKKNLHLEDIRQQTILGRTAIISSLYFACLLLLIAINQLPYSDKYKAAWIYFIAPVDQPGIILCGGIKAVVFKFFIPIAVLIALPLLVLAGPSLLPNLLLGLSNELLAAALIAYTSQKKLPFSQVQQMQERTGGFIRTLFLFLVIFVIAILHYTIYAITPLVYILIVLSVAATWYLLGSIKRISWAQLVIREYES